MAESNKSCTCQDVVWSGCSVAAIASGYHNDISEGNAHSRSAVITIIIRRRWTQVLGALTWESRLQLCCAAEFLGRIALAVQVIPPITAVGRNVFVCPIAWGGCASVPENGQRWGTLYSPIITTCKNSPHETSSLSLSFCLATVLPF